MHLCLTLQYKLNELKPTIDNLSKLADRVKIVEKFADFGRVKAEVEKEIKEKNKKFEDIRKELNGLKLNFEEELLAYLGLNKGDISIHIDDDGYIEIIFRIDITMSPYLRLKEVSPELSYLSHLHFFRLIKSNLIKPMLSTKSLTDLDFKDCKDIDPYYDLSYFDNVQKITFSYTKVINPKLPKNVLEAYFWNCEYLDPDYDFSPFTNLKKVALLRTKIRKLRLPTQSIEEVNCEYCDFLENDCDISEFRWLSRINFFESSVKNIFVSLAQWKRYLTGDLEITKGDEQNIFVKK